MPTGWGYLACVYPTVSADFHLKYKNRLHEALKVLLLLGLLGFSAAGLHRP
ncbi:hypothetical protein GE21DRAFT_1330179 [Neurospora crassa]|nr:hypothetical protein GE21DRAFT_1330179 [Neurospora crassa]